MSKRIAKPRPKAVIRLPSPHTHQEIFVNWHEQYPEAQCLVAPCGTKVGKTFGSSIWLLSQALIAPNLFCVWIAPTLAKSKIAYRYMKAMLPDHPYFRAIDSQLEIRLGNHSTIKFLHGRDAEVTVEGEAVDRFVIDESGKIKKQVWLSLFTTITQTLGYGIITGTPRGFTWYYKQYREAIEGDPFFCHATIKTEQSPFITKEAIANAKRILPPHLYAQYFEAKFTSQGSVFGDLNKMFNDAYSVEGDNIKFWMHPDQAVRTGSVIHGMDVAKTRDYTVVYSVHQSGQLSSFMRFRHVPYTLQGKRLETLLNRFYPTADNHLRYDATGVGSAFGDILVDLDMDCSITPVVFTNKSKADMVTRTTLAIEQGWHQAPRIPSIEQEFGSYEVAITKTGLHSYAAPEGEHDDIVSAGLLAISGAYQSSMAEEAEKMMAGIETEDGETDSLNDWASAISEANDNFFDTDNDDDDFDDNLLQD